MPELPEVETIRNDLCPLVVGRTIVGVRIGWEGCVDEPSVQEFCERIAGRRIEDVRRRGKFLILKLSEGMMLLVHLRMTGQLLFKEPEDPWDTHTRLALALDDGRELRFVDVRKFGRLYLVAEPEGILGSLGPEPLGEDFGVERFCTLFGDRRGMVKPLLLNQRFLAGLGNIYVDEALFEARLHPRRKADSLTREDLTRLYDAIRQVLRQGIDHGGTSLTDYVRPDGGAGRHQERLLVFRRAEEPCPRCGTIIERIVVGGRGTFICPLCQEEPPQL